MNADSDYEVIYACVVLCHDNFQLPKYANCRMYAGKNKDMHERRLH